MAADLNNPGVNVEEVARGVHAITGHNLRRRSSDALREVPKPGVARLADYERAFGRLLKESLLGSAVRGRGKVEPVVTWQTRRVASTEQFCINGVGKGRQGSIPARRLGLGLGVRNGWCTAAAA